MTLSGAMPPSVTTCQEFQQRIAELTRAVAARDTFIAVAAHELRNPMTPMIGQLDLLLYGIKHQTHSAEQIEHRVERVRQAMDRYVKRASVLLNVSRINSGANPLHPTPFDLARLIREIVETYAEAAQHAGCRISALVPERLPGAWDRLAIEQIIDNLVSNAIKYGAGRPVEVSARASGETVAIEIRDNGPGILVEDRRRIFDQFERAVGDVESRSGFGVGLWVASQLVGAMEGAITVDDAEGGGAVFKVTVPLRAKAGSL